MNRKRMLEELATSPEMQTRLEDQIMNKESLLGEGSVFSEMLQNMVNKILETEIEIFLKGEKQNGRKNKKNGKKTKLVTSELGMLQIETPRDRNSDFSPVILKKRERTLQSGLDNQIMALYAQGNSVEDVRRLLIEMFGVEISAGKISQITDSILPEIQEWKTRELEEFYPIIYLDAIHFKTRQDGVYKDCAFYTVYSVDWEGNRDLLCLHIDNGGEGSLKWGMILKDLKRRGVKDVLVMCTDDLPGFSGVIQEEFPSTILQKCIVHQIRNSLKYVDQKERKKVAGDLRKIYTSLSREQAKIALETFGVKWGDKYQYIVDQWVRNWDELMAFLDFPSDMQRMIYTTNPVEALHRIIRKLIKGKAAWVSQTALLKQIYLSLKYNKKSWKRKARGWSGIQRDIMKLYPNRVPQN
jgi:transposase-like protein